MTTLLSSLLLHPGHGTTDGTSLLHWLAEPLHAGAMLGLLAATALGVYALLRSSGARGRA